MLSLQIVADFSLSQSFRGFLCEAPGRLCGENRTINGVGVWFRLYTHDTLHPAHHACARSATTAS